jgi:hypothetical protein
VELLSDGLTRVEPRQSLIVWQCTVVEAVYWSRCFVWRRSAGRSEERGARTLVFFVGDGSDRVARWIRRRLLMRLVEPLYLFIAAALGRGSDVVAR